MSSLQLQRDSFSRDQISSLLQQRKISCIPLSSIENHLRCTNKFAVSHNFAKFTLRLDFCGTANWLSVYHAYRFAEPAKCCRCCSESSSSSFFSFHHAPTFSTGKPTNVTSRAGESARVQTHSRAYGGGALRHKAGLYKKLQRRRDVLRKK